MHVGRNKGKKYPLPIQTKCKSWLKIITRFLACWESVTVRNIGYVYFIKVGDFNIKARFLPGAPRDNWLLYRNRVHVTFCLLHKVGK